MGLFSFVIILFPENTISFSVAGDEHYQALSPLMRNQAFLFCQFYDGYRHIVVFLKLFTILDDDKVICNTEIDIWSCLDI